MKGVPMEPEYPMKPSDVNEPDNEMSVEEAAAILENTAKNVSNGMDNVYPWWKTLRRPFMIMSLTIVVLCASVIFLAHTLNNLSEDRATEQAAEDCQTFYRNEVTSALGQAVAALNSLIVAATAQPPALNDQERIERAEENEKLGQELDALTKPLLDAVDALNNYNAINPPPRTCPHPDSNA